MVALALGCLFTAVLLADQDGPTVRLTSARVLDVAPGRVVTASVLIANPSNRDASFDEFYQVPEGWHTVSEAATQLLIPARTQQVRLLGLAVPATAPAGSYHIQYRLTDPHTAAPLAAADLTVVVPPVVKLELVREDATDTVIAGDTYELVLRLINRGNSRVEVGLSTTATPDTAVHLDAVKFSLEPVSSRLIRATVASDATLQRRIQQVLRFDAVASLVSTPGLRATRSVVVSLLPRITGDRDPYIRMPAQMRFVAATHGHATAGQVEFSGGGYVDEASSRHLDFLFRGPSLDQQTPVGLRQEYRVDFTSTALAVRLGDDNYALSPLLQRFAYGRGIGVAYQADELSTGAFYMRTVERPENIETAGVYVRRNLREGISVQTNALYKSDGGTQVPSGPMGLFSVQPRFDFGAPLRLEVEYGVGTAGSGADSLAERFAAEGRLDHDKVTYALEQVHAGRHFFGYFDAGDTTQAAVTVPIKDELSGRASFNHDVQRSFATAAPDAGAALPTGSTWQAAYRPGLLLHVSPVTDVSLDYQDIDRRLIGATPAAHSLEQSMRLGVGQSHARLSTQAYAEFGAADTSTTGIGITAAARESVHRYSAFVSYRSDGQWYSVYGSLGTSTEAAMLQRTRSFGMSGHWALSKRLNLEGNYTRNQYDFRTARVQDSASATVNYNLPKGRAMGLHVYWSHPNEYQHRSCVVSLSYSVPFAVPVGKKKNHGSIRGTVVALTVGASQPMPRVILTANGLVAVTDLNGRFEFPSLAPGTYQLRIDQRSLGAERVTVKPLPMRIEVSKGRPFEVVIGVVRGASLKVRLAIFEPPPLRFLADQPRSDQYKAAGGLSQGLVEISDGVQVLRQVTDSDGQVSFDGIRPETWTVRVYQNNLPEGHFVETPQSTAVLNPGQDADVLIRILPKARPIHLIDGGAISTTPRQ